MATRADHPGPGWYPSPDGRGQRWWDGIQWTDGWVEADRHEAMADVRSPGTRLRTALERGWRPTPLPALISVSSTEQVYAQAGVEVQQLGGGQVGAYLGAPSAEAAPGWQPIDHGTVHMTTIRFAFQLSSQFANVPYAAVRELSVDDDGLCIWQPERAPIKVRIVDPEWHFVLYRWLAHGEPRPSGPQA